MAKHLSLTFFLLLMLSCKKKPFFQEERTFYMGVTPWPPDFTDIGRQKAYDFINTKCDMIVNHFDEGVPWQECIEGTQWPEEITHFINERLNGNKGRFVFLSIAPLDVSRKAKAKYWNKNIAGNIKNDWQNKSFDDTLVSNAYVAFCSKLIDTFQPRYLNYAVEANSKEWTQETFSPFLTFLSRVYTKLKIKYPHLPVFASYMAGLEDGFLENARKINPYSDYVSISSYPYSAISSAVYGSTEPQNIPGNWYSKFRDIAPEKPFAIAETGYIAEDLNMSEYGLTKKGDPKWQADFLQDLFELCNKYDAEFVNYFCAYDYDNGYSTMQSIGVASPIFKLWKDIGLYDGNGIARPSLSVWEKWYKAEVK